MFENKLPTNCGTRTEVSMKMVMVPDRVERHPQQVFITAILETSRSAARLSSLSNSDSNLAGEEKVKKKKERKKHISQRMKVCSSVKGHVNFLLSFS